MSNLSMREIRRHPDVITEPSDFQPGMDVALCYLIPPISKVERCAQALIGLNTETDTPSKRERMKIGYSYTPTWGIIIDDVGTVNWINATNPMYEHPYACLTVTRSTGDLSLEEKLRNPVMSIDEVRERIQEVPLIERFNSQGEIVNHSQLITGFQTIGLAAEPYGLGKFVLHLSR